MCFELLHSLPLQNRTSTNYIDGFTSQCRWCLRHLTSLLITLAWLTFTEYLCHKLIIRICSTCRKQYPIISSFMTYNRVCNQSNTTGATSRAGYAYPFGASEFNPVFSWVLFPPSLVKQFCGSLSVILSFSFCPLCCLFFVDRLVIFFDFATSMIYSIYC